MLRRFISSLVDTTFSIILIFSAGAVTLTPPNFKLGVFNVPFNVTLVSVNPIRSDVAPIPIFELVILIFPALTVGAVTVEEAEIVPLALTFLSPAISVFSSVTIALLDAAVPFVTEVK